METYTLIVLLLAATIRVATPLLLAAIAGLEPHAVETNILLIDLSTRLPTASAFAAVLKTEGLLVLPFGPRRLRFVTHLDVDSDACEKAAAIIARVVDGLPR